jgi:2-alkenal reductase
MKYIRQQPVFILAILLLFTGLACQAFSSTVAVPPLDEATVVEAAVATVEARLPAAAGQGVVPTITAVQSLPLNTDLEATLVSVYQRVNPAVVHIFVLDSSGAVLGTGSGFVLDVAGHVVTNNHVVADGVAFQANFANGESSRATLAGADVDSDLAILTVEKLPDGVMPVPLGDSTAVQVGQFVVAIGNPFGEAGSMSVGIISGLGRTLESQRIAEGGGRYSLPQVIQTDAAINPGNSGGPLLNLNGEVIGVNSAILTRTGANSGVGFSIPVAAVKRIAPALIADGAYTYPYIGIRMSDNNLSLQELLALTQTTGVYVTEVSPGTPAERAGMAGSGFDQVGTPNRGGDLITAIDGVPVQDTGDLITYLVFHTEVGQTVQVTVLRDGEEVTLPLTLGARP